MGKIIWAPSALDDIDAIAEYIAYLNYIIKSEI